MTLPQVPTIPNVQPGQAWTSAMFNGVVGQGLSLLLNPPMARLYQATAQTLPSNALASITFDATLQDTYGGHSNTVNNQNYVVQLAGTYAVTGMASFAANTTGFRQATVMYNGASIGKEQAGASPSFETCLSAGILIPCNVGDTLGLAAWQNSGGTLATVVSSQSVWSFLHIIWVHA